MSETLSQKFNEKELKLSYWFNNNKFLLRKQFTIFLIFVCLGLFAFIAWQSFFYSFNYQRDEINLHNLALLNNPSSNYLNINQPANLQISTVQALSGRDEGYDLAAMIANPNKNWLATFDFAFTGANTSTHWRQGFTLPSEQKYLMDFGINSGPTLEIKNIKWEKLNNYQQLYKKRYNFIVVSQDFKPTASSSEPSRANLVITNNSAYSYWNVEVKIYLYSASNLVSDNAITVNEWPAGETKNLQLSWNNNLPRIDSMDTFVEVNFLDPHNIKPPTGQNLIDR
ncbi:MAG: hypothetical protein WCP18_02675 [bacterium]